MKTLICALALAAMTTGCATTAPVQSDAAATPAAAPAADPAIAAVVAGPWRTAEARVRDQYRHPAESLAFWGLRPGMRIVEIGPGGPQSWWTPMLAAYAQRTGGSYVAGYGDLGAPGATDAARKARADFLAAFSDKATFGDVTAVDFGPRSGLALPDASVDFVLVARAFHNWSTGGNTARYMQEFARVLKPGGVLAVEQHRAAADADVTKTASQGYVPESYVIAEAERVGLALAARSEINANPKDDRDHPFGVWTLPPTRVTAPYGQPVNPAFDRAPYDAVGESDRMTLRFVKR